MFQKILYIRSEKTKKIISFHLSRRRREEEEEKKRKWSFI